MNQLKPVVVVASVAVLIYAIRKPLYKTSCLIHRWAFYEPVTNLQYRNTDRLSLEVSNRSSGMRNQMVQWHFFDRHTGDPIADVDFDTTTGQVGTARSAYVDSFGLVPDDIKHKRVVSMLRSVQREIENDGHVSEMWECGPCYPDAWKELGAAYSIPMKFTDESITKVVNGHCTGGGYVLKITKGWKKHG